MSEIDAKLKDQILNRTDPHSSAIPPVVPTETRVTCGEQCPVCGKELGEAIAGYVCNNPVCDLSALLHSHTYSDEQRTCVVFTEDTLALARRTRAAAVVEIVKLGNALADAAQADWDCTDDRGDDAMRIASRLEAALTAWRTRALLEGKP